MNRDLIALGAAIVLGAGWQIAGHREPALRKPPVSYIYGLGWILAGVAVRAALGERPGLCVGLVDLIVIIVGNGLAVLAGYGWDAVLARIDRAELEGHRDERRAHAA